ncbi:MAG: diguanylate cyclase [Oscillospiraceae bacterium]
MKKQQKQHSLVNRILIIVCTAIFVLGVIITSVDSRMIYTVTENSIKTEIQSAAETMKNLYEHELDVYADSFEISADDFNRIIGYISCSKDVDFTIFHGDTRVFTSIINPDGSSAVGTKASEEVIEKVIGGGQEYFYSRVMVNGQLYIGYYIPLFDRNKNVSGMYFAGKPLDSAKANSTAAMRTFILISAAVLIISTGICFFYLKNIINGMLDIKQYITKVANGDFTAALSSATISRCDEIGDIGRNAEMLCGNLRDMVERDPLTSLFNRRSCRRKIQELDEKSISYSLVMGDIDFFKNINDKYGHSCGDDVLKSISAMLSSHAAENGGWAARWGGEEFLFVYPQKDIVQVKSLLDEVAEEIRSAKYNGSNNECFGVTMTFGAACHFPDESFDETICRADELLYKGKQSGRNRIEI